MLTALQKQPWYLFLLPLFFVLHGFTENFGFINFWDAAILAGIYVIATATLFFLFFLFLKNRIKASLITSFVMAFYLFFGAIQDFCKVHLPTFNKYSVFLSIFLVLFVALAVYLKKVNSPFSKLNLFLNSLFLIYIIVDLGSLIYENFNLPLNKLSIYSVGKDSSITPCQNCFKPDIYFLLFDEYESSASLKKRFNFDNSSLDTFLTNQGFHIQARSTSNYNFTPFSMASMLNMSYLTGIDPAQISLADYARCNALIKKNRVINFLSAQGYQIENYSVFDLAGNPTLLDQDILPVKTKLITDGTLFARMQKDLGWMLVNGRFRIKWWADKMFFATRRNNEKVISLLEKATVAKPGSPRFIYGHLFLPHLPFYFDKNGNPKSPDVIYHESKNINTEAYLDYVTYTNSIIKKLVTTIKNNTNNNAAIIIMGDHGFRKETKDHDKTHYFENQNAVYLPSKDYRLFYDRIIAVNQFGIIFNTLFDQKFPVLKDSTIFLKDKK